MQAEWGIAKGVAKKLTMKSRHLFAQALRDPSDSRPVAVIVVESTVPNGLKIGRIRSYLGSDQATLLSGFIEHSDKYAPQPTVAYKAGY